METRMANETEGETESMEDNYLVADGFIRNCLAQAIGCLAEAVGWLAEASVTAEKMENMNLEETLDEFMGETAYLRDRVGNLMAATEGAIGKEDE